MQRDNGTTQCRTIVQQCGCNAGTQYPHPINTHECRETIQSNSVLQNGLAVQVAWTQIPCRPEGK
eukprot:4121-Pelagomonas_calceolata.AAC.3